MQVRQNSLSAPTPSETLAVVILNFRSAGLTIQALESLSNELVDLQTQSIALTVWIVDNHSVDDSVSMINDAIHTNHWTEWCRLIVTKQNSGFSAGNNFGISNIEADYVLLLNSDTVVMHGALKRLVEEASHRPDFKLFSPRLCWPDMTPQISCFQFICPATELTRAAATGPITRLFRYAAVPWQINDDGGHDRCHPDWTSFACVLVRREVFAAIGLLDEGYFMYYEDVDFCRRAKEAGFLIRHVPDAKVIHLRGGSSPVKELQAARKRRPRYYYAARTRYFAKQFGLGGLLSANLFWHVGHVVALSRRLLEGRAIPACKSEWRDIWTNFWRPLTGPNR